MYSKCEFYFLSIISVIFTLNCGAVYCLNQRGPTDQPSETYRHKRGSKFTIEELQNTQFATTISGDIDVDICKAVGFLGDIAIPNDQYDKEYLHQLKQEVIEGLQVEEEGLTDDIRIKLKQATSESSTQTSSHYNDPVDRSSGNLKSTKHGIGLNGYGKVYTNDDISKKEYLKQSNVDANNKQETKTNVYDDTNFDPAKKHGASDIRNIRNGSESNRATVLNSNSSEINVKNDTIVAIFGEIKNKQNTVSENETTFETNEQQSRVATRQRNRNRNEMRTDRKKLTSVAHDEDVSEISSTTEADERRERRRHRRRRRRFRKRKSKHGTSQLSNSDTVAESQTSDRKQRKTRSVKYVTDSTLEPATSNTTQTNSYINPINNTFVRQNNITGSVPHETLSESVGHIPVDSIVYKLLNRQSTVSDNETPVHEFERNFDYPRHKETKPVENEAVYHMQHNITAEEDAMLSLSGRQGRVTRAATARKERVWDHGVIPYEIDGNFSGAHKTLFKQAMRHWENYTCVKFVERVNEEHPNYILFTERPCGCCSFVGKRGNGAQAISIGKNCDKFGIVVHELGHVVGFWHEHTRPDRDHHVQIFREHIMSGQEYNFNKLTDEEVNSLGLPYDYDSIMHYARNTFSRGTYLDTIAPHEKQVRGRKPPEIGQRLRLSQGDIAQTNLLYKCPKCGRTFQDHTAIFSSPGYPEPAPAGTDGERCEWRITATLGEHIVLNITELDVHKSSDCATDYLEVRDGYWHRSPVLGRFCGSGRLPDPIVSTTSRMLVTYITSSRQTNHRGFIASYEAVCGGEYEVTTAGGHLESPNFPEDYFRNKECIWKLIVPETYTVALQFQAFEIENHDNCVYDYVEVIDGFEVDSPVIGKFCGYKPPPEIKSTSNTLLVKFFSDASVQKGGFSARFVQEHNECDQTDHGCEHYCINTLGSYECSCRMGYELHSDRKSCEVACGGIYDTPNGTITSPSFPDLYPGNKNCMWEIIAPPQYRITLNFTHFDLEGNHLYHQECEYDSVKVQSKLGTDIIRIHGTYCGTILPDMITSEGNALRVIFDSDLSVHKSGFAAVFFTDMDECAVDNGGCQHECTNTIGSYKCSCHNGFILHENEHDCKEGGCKFEITAPYGEIESPNYPDYYPSRKDCVWHFVTTPGHRIKLVFDKFEMEPHQECAYDHIVLYDGDSPESRTLGRFCGSKTPHPILATSNQMFMVFKSDASVQRKGFKAIHSTACGGHLQASDTVKHLYSHSKYGDYSYTNRAECDWSIEAGPGRSVHLTFLTFELEDETNCGYDFVEIYNGLDASGPSYGRFCGNQNPPDIISNNDALLVRFHSDDTIVSKGFSAAYVALDQFDDEIEDEAIQNNSELDENRF